MAVQLFLSEVIATLAFFALGVAGYALSKHGKAWLLRRRLVQLGKSSDSVADREIVVAFEEMQPSQPLTKKATTQAKKSEARRRAKRQGRSRVHDELIAGAETPGVQDANEERFKEHDIALTVVIAGSRVEEVEELNAEQAEPMVEMPASMVNAPLAKGPSIEKQPASPVSSASTRSGEEMTEEEEEGTTTPVTHDDAELLEHLHQDADERDNIEAPRAGEQYEPTMVPSEIGSDVGLQDFTIPSTPPYEDEVLMPTYELNGEVFPDTPTNSPRGDNGGAFPDTPTSANAFTDGQQVFEPMPSVTPEGHQLYTDGQQVFMLACVEVAPSEPSTPCVGMQSGLLASTDPFCQLASTCGDFLGDATHDSQAYSGSYGNAVKDDLWDVCWEDFLPGAFPPRAGF